MLRPPFDPDAVAAAMNALPWVLWDRLVERADGLHAYGWVERGDGRSDFVVLTWAPDGSGPEYLTSSALRSREVRAALGCGPSDCRRVFDEVPGARRSVSWSNGNLDLALPPFNS
jgi:hypothetical protein